MKLPIPWSLFVFALLLGLGLGLVLGGVMNEPWWYVFPISLAGGIAIGLAGRRR